MGEAGGAPRGSGRRRFGSPLGDEDPPIAHGAALGVGGIEGWWAWRHRRQTRRGMQAVSPATWRGALHVALWFCGLIAITLAGPVVVDGPRWVWFVIALIVMLAVGRWWDASRSPASRPAPPPR